MFYPIVHKVLMKSRCDIVSDINHDETKTNNYIDVLPPTCSSGFVLVNSRLIRF